MPHRKGLSCRARVRAQGVVSHHHRLVRIFVEVWEVSLFPIVKGSRASELVKYNSITKTRNIYPNLTILILGLVRVLVWLVWVQTDLAFNRDRVPAEKSRQVIFATERNPSAHKARIYRASALGESLTGLPWSKESFSASSSITVPAHFRQKELPTTMFHNKDH